MRNPEWTSILISGACGRDEHDACKRIHVCDCACHLYVPIDGADNGDLTDSYAVYLAEFDAERKLAWLAEADTYDSPATVDSFKDWASEYPDPIDYQEFVTDQYWSRKLDEHGL